MEFFAGCLGGCAGIVVGHPLDTIKVRLQTQNGRYPMYRGMWQCLTHIVSSESPKALYKGLTSPICGVAFVNAVIFGTYANIVKHSPAPDSLSTHFIAGASTGFVQSFIASPIELVKNKMQLLTNKPTACLYKNSFHCMKTIYLTEGCRGIFKGQVATTLREIPAFGVYFLSYEWMLRTFESQASTSLAILTAGGLAGIASWIISYPMDVIKTRLQADGMDGFIKYRGLLHCFETSLAEEGWCVMTRGLSSAILRAFPTNAATFAVVSWTMKAFEDSYENDVSHNWMIDTEKMINDLIMKSNVSELYKTNYHVHLTSVLQSHPLYRLRSHEIAYFDLNNL